MSLIFVIQKNIFLMLRKQYYVTKIHSRIKGENSILKSNF